MFVAKKKELRENNALESYLVEHDYVTQQIVDSAKLQSRETGDDTGVILVQNGFIRQATLVDIRMDVDPSNLSKEHVFINNIPPEVLVKTNTVLHAQTSSKIFVSSLSPQATVQLAISEHDPRQLIFVACNMDNLVRYMNDLAIIQSQDNEAMMERMIREAIKYGASDIHIRPRGRTFSVLFRYNGVLQLVEEGSIDEYYPLRALIKGRANMDPQERRRPQGGGFNFEYIRTSIDLRVQSTPVASGEEVIVIRLLNPDAVNPNLNSLGITNVKHWRDGILRNNGICFICGPTGSGKTTTLNSTIGELNRFEKHICTVEDPVEYNISYVTQVNINLLVGLDFKEALRSFLRLDPDVIIVGEIRDIETAELALKASETGHMVLATLHAGSIHGAIARLREIGVRPEDLVHFLRSILVQRLVRTICHVCQGEGCSHCRETGYDKRTIVSECAYFHTKEDVVRMTEGEKWWANMVDDAISKAKEGITDMDEVERVFKGEYDDDIATQQDEKVITVDPLDLDLDAESLAMAEMSLQTRDS